MTRDGETIRYEREGGIGRIVLNRPAHLNAISPRMLEELSAVLDEIDTDPRVRVVTVTGEGRAFCAGADLLAVREILDDPHKVDQFLRLCHRVFNRVESLAKPVIAGVHGLALAGGLELVLVCDIVVADEDARLGDQHANFGLVAGGGGTQRLPRLIGLRRAMELILTGNWLTAREALALGLINRLAPAGRLAEALAELAAELLRKSPAASAAAKNLIRRGAEVDLQSALEMEILAVTEHFRSPDVREGLTAFEQKREPAFP